MIMTLDMDVTAEGGIIKLIAREGDTTTLGPKAPSNLKTLRPQGPVHLKNFFHNLFLQPFYTTRRRQAATTFGPEGRQPFPSQPFYTTYGEAVPLCA